MKPRSALLLCALLPLGLTVSAEAAAAKKPAAKPAPKKPASAKPAAPRVVLGTTQLAGDNGQIGVTYTLGKDEPLNFTLNAAEFSVEPVRIGENAYTPAAAEKLLVLRYTVQNPNKFETSYLWESLTFTAVDEGNTNRPYIQDVGKGGTEQTLNISLKPAQKVDAYAVIVVPAKGTVPKLMVERETGAPVLRYDLRGKIKGLAAPFADSEDKSGATAPPEVAAEPGRFYPMREVAVKLVSTGYSAGPIHDTEAEEGQRFFVATYAIRNQAATEVTYDFSTITPRLETSDGEKVEYNNYLLKEKRDEDARGTLKPGEEATVRVYFPLPSEAAAATLALQEGESRVYRFKVN